ncbi:His/Gly/Thr/Pro-type tRNA ligase C-terminal domain-containing protein, partial [Cupriavidus sp. 2MCAB6]
FPLWLAPEQILVCPITSEADAYAEQVTIACMNQGLRARADLRNEKISYKVREHSLAKVPVILAVGKREAEERTVTVRRLGSQQQTVMSLDEALVAFTTEAMPPDLVRRRAEMAAS